MKKILLVASVLFGFTASAAQAQITLLDQIGPDATGVNGQAADASQRFEAAFAPQFNCACGDNFVVPVGGPVMLSHVRAVLTPFNTPTGVQPFTQVQNYAVEIYSSPAVTLTNANVPPGDISSTTIPAASANVTLPFGTNVGTGLVDINMASFNVTLAPGTYWLAVIPRMDFSAGGQFGTSLSTFGGGGGDGFQSNPGGGFAIPGNINLAAGNFAFSITANPVPEPTSIALVGMGLAGFGWRRFRKR